MREIIGLLVALAGILLGLWLGVWVMFIGGIVQLIEAVKMTPVSATGIAYGIARILLSGVVGWLAGLVLVGLGLEIMKRRRI